MEINEIYYRYYSRDIILLSNDLRKFFTQTFRKISGHKIPSQKEDHGKYLCERHGWRELVVADSFHFDWIWFKVSSNQSYIPGSFPSIDTHQGSSAKNG